jgi:hypothetical protein
MARRMALLRRDDRRTEHILITGNVPHGLD